MRLLNEEVFGRSTVARPRMRLPLSWDQSGESAGVVVRAMALPDGQDVVPLGEGSPLPGAQNGDVPLAAALP